MLFVITVLLYLCIAGAAAVADCHCQTVPEETHRHPGIGTASTQSGYKGTVVLDYWPLC
jgi:hypothetical protein